MAMFGTPRPLASLSSGLLARKGQARPAMRPQGFASMMPTSMASEDLGWNDMGVESAVAPAPVAAPLPAVLTERETLARDLASVDPAPVTEPITTAPAPVTAGEASRIGRESAAQTSGGKAAFTLRLDPHRHLRMRLASAVTNRSAQALVAEALDRFIRTIPEVETLAAQLPPAEEVR